MDATSLFFAMQNTIDYTRTREVNDPQSPAKQRFYEAVSGQSFVLDNTRDNVVQSRKINLRWAAVNTIHFFANTEDADQLPKYNRHAEKFLTDDKKFWRGAYGYIAMPQINKCIELLSESANTRRAIVSMGDCMVQDINRPACWSFLQFLSDTKGALDLLVYQRSLNLYGVMPYDCILLTNVLNYVAHIVNARVGSLKWTIGSLHTEFTAVENKKHNAVDSIMFTPALLFVANAVYNNTRKMEELLEPYS